MFKSKKDILFKPARDRKRIVFEEYLLEVVFPYVE